MMSAVRPRSRTSRGPSPCAPRLPSVAGYRLGTMLGAGRAAAVYLAERCAGGERVALKVVKRSAGREALPWHWFAAECEMLSAIHDEHVVAALEYGRQGELAFLAMEYLEGGTLRRRLGAPIEPSCAVSLLQQAAQGLAVLHRDGIVHRDVRPENFLIRKAGALVVADLGVASRVGQGASHSMAGRLVGTLCYAAPEQVQGERPSPAADVYSLGILFHEMLCGRPPFAGATSLELVAQQLVAPPPPLPAALARYQPIIARMLAKRPECRPADAGVLLEEIQRLVPATVAGPTD